MKEKCDVCGIKEWERCFSGKFVCLTCDVPLEGFPATVDTVVLLKGIPGSVKTSRRELEEIKRNVCIPISKNHWKFGRRGENGKIQERPIKV